MSYTIQNLLNDLNIKFTPLCPEHFNEGIIEIILEESDAPNNEITRGMAVLTLLHMADLIHLPGPDARQSDDVTALDQKWKSLYRSVSQTISRLFMKLSDDERQYEHEVLEFLLSDKTRG